MRAAVWISPRRRCIRLPPSRSASGCALAGDQTQMPCHAGEGGLRGTLHGNGSCLADCAEPLLVFVVLGHLSDRPSPRFARIPSCRPIVSRMPGGFSPPGVLSRACVAHCLLDPHSSFGLASGTLRVHKHFRSQAECAMRSALSGPMGFVEGVLV